MVMVLFNQDFVFMLIKQVEIQLSTLLVKMVMNFQSKMVAQFQSVDLALQKFVNRLTKVLIHISTSKFIGTQLKSENLHFMAHMSLKEHVQFLMLIHSGLPVIE